MQQRMTRNKRAILNLLATAAGEGYTAMQIAKALDLDLANASRTLKALVASGALVAAEHSVTVRRLQDAISHERPCKHYTLLA